VSTSTKPRTLAELVKQRRRLGLPVGRDLARAAASDLGDLRFRPGCSIRIVAGQAVSVREADGEPVAARRSDQPADVQYLRLRAALINERFERRQAERERRRKARSA